MTQLTNKVALITGGGTGIGLAIAEDFLARGAKVVVTGRRKAPLEALALRFPERVAYVQADVTNSEAVNAAVTFAAERFGQIDVLVNNAGAFVAKPLVETTDDEIAQLLGVNVSGVLYFSRAAIPHLAKTKGSIVNVSSGLAFVPYVAAPIYSATKAASHAWTRSLRKQLAKTSVTVVELMPPVVDTALAANVEGIPKMAPDKLAASFKKGKTEIKPGLSATLSGMSRFAPRFIFNRLNKE